MPIYTPLRVFSGRSHPELTKGICSYLGIPLGQASIFKFSNDNTFVQFLENIRGRDVFLVQPFAYPVNDTIMELLIMIDAAKRASAGRITVVVPYYAYGRTDKKDQPRVPITARLLADLLTIAGAHRVLTIDLHSEQIQGFFSIPVDELSARPLLTRYIREKGLDNLVVVAVDIGISKAARDMAQRLGVPLAIIEKRRLGNLERTKTLSIIGDVQGKVAVTLDDEIDTAESLMTAAEALLRAGVREIYACATHGVFSGPAIERINASPIREVVVTDTLPLAPNKRIPKITVLSVAPLLGEAIRRIHEGLSVGAMFAE
ncbi:MAG: ribose-phosphate diphosphokinase [Dehalococcoidia bacterium]